MNKPEPILTDAEMHDLISSNPFILGLSIARLKDFIRQVEKAVVTKKKAEQRPAAWRVHPFDNGAGIEGAYAITQEETLAESWRRKGWKVTPLYAHPCVSQNGRCEKHESQIPDGTLIDEGTKGQHRSIDNHIPDGGQMSLQRVEAVS